MRRRRPLAVIAGLSAGFACDDGRGPLDLETIPNPEVDCVAVVHESLELGGTIEAFVSDQPGARGGWALASTVVDGAPVFGMIRVPTDDQEPPTEPIVVGVGDIDPASFSLRVGTEPGTAWLLRDDQVGPVVLSKLAPGVGVEVSNASLANFPTDESGAECPDLWSRQLLLIEGRPFLIAIPDCSDGPGVELHLLELDEQLAFVTNWTLAFDPCVGLTPRQCAFEHAYQLDSIRAGQSTQLVDASRIGLGFTQVRAIDDGLPNPSPVGLSTDVSMLDLQVGEAGPDARLITFRDVWWHTLPLPLGSVELARDPEATQLFVPNYAQIGDSALFRLDPIHDLYLFATGASVLPFEGRGTLVQLDRASAIVHLDDGHLLGASLLDEDEWGAILEHTLYETDDLIGFASAGPGMLLLWRAEHAAQVLQVACIPDG